MSTPTPSRTKVFVSYSHADKDWLGRLRPYLKFLETTYKFEIWDDTKIRAGAKWHDQIRDAIQSAKVAILLISEHFLASDFVNAQEVPALLEAAEKDGATILGLIIRPCLFEDHSALSQLQTINPPSKTLEEMSTADQARTFVTLAREIRAALDESRLQARLVDRVEEGAVVGASAALSLIVESNTDAVSGDGRPTENIGIETAGGVLSPWLHAGLHTPCSTTQIFITSEDDQTAIRIALFRGLVDEVAKAHNLGVFTVVGFRPGPKYVPRIRVSLSVRGRDIVLEALDEISNQALPIWRGHS